MVPFGLLVIFGTIILFCAVPEKKIKYNGFISYKKYGGVLEFSIIILAFVFSIATLYLIVANKVNILAYLAVIFSSSGLLVKESVASFFKTEG